MNIRRGGKTVYGATVGILMLETRFPRIPGDMGNALTWPFPVQYRVVRGASPDRVVRGDPRELTDAFIAAGRDLVAAGCDGITTNCGFLALASGLATGAERVYLHEEGVTLEDLLKDLEKLRAGFAAGRKSASR